jgi:beta-glucosidase
VQIDDLLARLTIAERIALLHQFAPAAPAAGLAAFRTGTEALHGVSWLGEATVFPQAVGLGATWNPALLERVGRIVGTEVRAMHAADPTVSLNVWAPVVNLLRDPRWGRNEEGYSEDPLLTSRLATAYCRGLRGSHPDVVLTAPTLKHFLAYNNEDDRTTTSSSLRPRVLHEYDLPAFQGPVSAGVVDAVMPAYNLVNGRPAHLSPLLNDLLRGWSEHDLLIVSDAWAPSNLVDSQHYLDDHEAAHAAALRAGVDSFTDQGDDPSITVERLTGALRRGLIDEKDVDRAVRRQLALRARTGEFDPATDPYAAIGADARLRPEYRELNREVAREQVVLLRNHGGLLPLRPAPGLRVAVVGPFATTLCEDWYSGTMPYRVSVADGLRAALEPAGGDVVTAEGCDRVELRGAGLDGEFDVFDWGDDVVTLRSVATGRYLAVLEDGALGTERFEPGGWDVRETFRLTPADAAESGALSRSVLRNVLTGREDVVTVRVVREGRAEARALAEPADVVVVVVGNDPHVNGRETQDRTTLALPPGQDALVRAVAGTGVPTVLVVMSSYPYALGWAGAGVPAIVWTSHAGPETGHALADVLLGAHSPTGRLPQTWYRSDADLPGILEYDVIKARRTYQYFEGAPLYPFGHGLTYSTFGYGPASVEVAGDGPDGVVRVEVELTNTGPVAATEVVQVYTHGVDAAPDRPRRRLQAFDRVRLEPGAGTTVRLGFPLAQLAHWDVASHEMRVEPGVYEVTVGPSAGVGAAVGRFPVTGPPRGPRPVVDLDVAAVDFDDYAGVTLVDTTREAGEAVQAGPEGGWLLYRAADLSSPPARFTARVSRTGPGSPDSGGRLTLRTGGPDGCLVGVVDVPVTGDRYAWVEIGGSIEGGAGVHDLCWGLPPDVRLDSFRLRTR